MQPDPAVLPTVISMVCIELSFTDDPARLTARPEHRRLLEELHRRGALLAAGPWDDDSGALLILDTGTQEADEVMAADPYFTTAGVSVVAVRTWQPVIGP